MTGTTTCAIGERDGKVIISFPKPVEWAEFDTETARQIGEAIAKEAYKVRYGVDPGGKSVVSEEVRGRLIVRCTHVIRSLTEQGKPHGYTAAQVIDTILAEVM